MREQSFMIVIPKNRSVMDDPKGFLDNLAANEHINIKNVDMEEERGLVINLEVDGKPHQINVFPTDVEVPPIVRPEHVFSEEEYQLIDEARSGIVVNMDFDEENARCFHDQLRIIDAMFPDILAVLDCPAEKLLSGVWVSLAAQSDTPPSPRYLFTVQAISGDNDEVWLHSHGLKRCGMYELEILCSDSEMCNEHYKIIESFAFQMIENEEAFEPGEAVFVAQISRSYVVCTAVDWKEALKFYPEATLGTEEDRDDEVHSEDTYVLMMYNNPDAEKAKQYSKIQLINPHLKNNPMFLFSNSETERMRSLAVERIPYMKMGFENKDNKVIVKIGLLTDKEYWKDDKPQREHIWFELKEVKEDSVVAELTQEPYYVSGIKPGDTGTYPFSDITDWLIYTKDGNITPDDAYRLI
ncbi:MAG: DUF4026 domain-containing protein [Clostridiales bacterium]|nr:DUF4026 domain-containing protein [Clostridiales bacterium]